MTPEQITKPTTAQCREFTLLLGELKHYEVESKTYDYGVSFENTCKCGFHTPHDIVFMSHIDKNTPTYDSATILAKIKEKGLYEQFICYLFDEEYPPEDIKECSMMGDTLLRILNYIFSPRQLIEKALEFMRQENIK